MARRRMTSIPAVLKLGRRFEQVNDWNAFDVCDQESHETQYECQNSHLEYLEAQPPQWAG